MMTRFLANAFLFLFGADALLSLWLGVFGAASTPLRMLHGALAALTLLAGLFVYGLLALSPRLPKRIFLPCLLFLGWGVLGGMPLPLWFGGAKSFLCLAAIQAALAAGAFLWLRLRGGSIFLTREGAAGPRFRLGYCALFLVLHALLLPPFLAGYVAGSAAAGVEHFSRGFVEVDWRGLEVQERVYVRDGIMVRLVPMVHIGTEDFYNGVVQDLRGMKGVVLLEGVTDHEGLITQQFSYGKTAGALGVSEQPRSLVGDGKDLVDEEEGEPGLVAQHADLDVSEFSPQTVAFINSIGKLLSSDNLLMALPEYLLTPVNPEVLTRDILTLRNEALLVQVDESPAETDHIIIPWGAAHMPGLEAGLLERGFSLTSQRPRMVFHW